MDQYEEESNILDYYTIGSANLRVLIAYASTGSYHKRFDFHYK